MSMHFDFKAANELNIVEVAERLNMTLKKRGNRYVSLCPWHDDKSPSLVFYEHRCHCFACNESKSVLDLVMEVEGVDVRGAMEWLGFSPSPLPSHVGRGSRKSQLPSEGGRTKRRMGVYEQDAIINRAPLGSSWKKEEDLPVTFLDMEVLGECGMENSFVKCMLNSFPKDLVEVFCRLYKLGTYSKLGRRDDVMFPSIDRKMRLHNVKIQSYDCNPKSKRFMHCDKNHIFWLGDLLKKQGLLPEDARFDNSTLFGEHLLPANPNETVVLVESPKNAIIGALRCPTRVWVATGNKNNLTRRSLEALRGRRVIVIPDNDALEEWTAKLKAMEDIADFTISSFCEVLKRECGEKGDLADWGKEPLTPIHNS